LIQDATTSHIVRTSSDLGDLIRNQRKRLGYTNLERATRACSVGKRFLSECERGKATAEIGKVLDVLHGLGLEMAVVHRVTDDAQAIRPSARPLSQTLGLDFPYDWSNPDMNEDTFIHHVLEKSRFMDVLRLTRHYGLNRVETAALAFVETPHGQRLTQILDRIRAGKLKAAV